MAAQAPFRMLIPTYNRAGRLTTVAALPGLPYEIACHTDKERDALLRAQPELDAEHVHVSHAPSGPLGGVKQMAWLARAFLQPWEWAIFADDNVRAMTGVRPEIRKEHNVIPVQDKSKLTMLSYDVTSWYRLFRFVYDTDNFLLAAHEGVQIARGMGFHLLGFSTTPAWLYRGKRWRNYGYACSKLILMDNDPTFPWEEVTHMWDTHISAEHSLRHGGLLVDNWLYPEAPDYAPGGLGPYEQRVPHLRASGTELLARYPGLLRWGTRPGHGPQTAIEFNVHSYEATHTWRERYLGSMKAHGQAYRT